MIHQEQTTCVEWDFIVSSIAEKKTILFIGEELTFGYSNKMETKSILHSLVKKRENYIASFHGKDSFLVFNELGKKK